MGQSGHCNRSSSLDRKTFTLGQRCHCGADFFLLVPSESCAGDILDCIRMPRRAAVRDDGGPHAPTQSALEMGKVAQQPTIHLLCALLPPWPARSPITSYS